MTHGDYHEPALSATGGGWVIFDLTSLLVLLIAALAYGAGAWRNHGRWPWWRTGFWLAGLTCVGAALIGPLGEAARTGFTAHMAGHLLLGMLAPLLLVLAAPVSLALRILPVNRARRLSRVLRSQLVRVIGHPVTAAILNAGGLWLLYATPLYHLMHSSLWLHGLVHAHVLIAGIVFTVAIISPDPIAHRASFRLRAAVMVVFIAVHSILGKWLYAYPPEGVDIRDAQVGAQLMYYGGDIIDVVLLVLLFLGWYPATRSRTSGTAVARHTLLRANSRPAPRSAPSARLVG